MNYTEEALGTVSLFLIPELGLRDESSSGETFEKEIENFFLDKFGSCTFPGKSVIDYRLDPDKASRRRLAISREYTVAIKDAEAVLQLKEFLARIASEMRLKSMYLEINREAMLLTPSA